MNSLFRIGYLYIELTLFSLSFAIMSNINKIQLKPSSILNVHLQKYPKDFTFIVNGKEFQTSRIISDLLSPKICKNHFNDIVKSIRFFRKNPKDLRNWSIRHNKNQVNIDIKKIFKQN